MRDILADIQSGRFAAQWISEYDSGGAEFQRLRQQDRDHQIERVGARLRAQMAWLDPVEVVAGPAHGGARGVRGPAPARSRDGAPQRGIEALLPAEKPHLHLFIATSDIHLVHKLRMDREQALQAAVHWVRYAREALGRDAEIEFSAEDASRTEHDFLLRVYEAVVDAGATTVNIPDTVGYAIPTEFAALTRKVVERVGSGAVVSVHCHH